ncbi:MULTISPECIES: bifunctional RNase H/acid phosphatase [Streptomyces]|uniref:Bifunctional RNase H/acid phosphatase n=1 Tax=Streptomyces koelreuteriae TaxID=2838015 RepID=A0ABX8FXK8_9ACTN|nr:MULTISPECIES: bifunctional RNase H/acid phosphatase [Streptomyces]QWB25958.1 bifunctional RNase H/acid phosphatase [Streptomyces koelreuteriae]UUA09025.1 bifunctional RNase H/acid phosphatase [Streptomyces koelreuteriae]UUA16630.1 bifunctional RNase H/acid phosphatase [Streptomyces sp. CRCS-T-1]
MREFIVEADGGSRGNPGPAGYGAVVSDAATGETLREAAEYIGVATNNVAEYRGLLAGLRAAHELDPAATVHVRMDSKLVIEQMSGRWKIKHPDMKPLAAESARVFPPGRVTYEWMPREQNKHADRLANEAMDAGARGEQWSEAASTAELDAALDAKADPDEPDASAQDVRAAAEADARSAGAKADADARAAKAVAAPGWAPADMGAPATFVLLRHGETPLTPQKRFSGSGGTDPSLSDVGREQAERAAALLARRGTIQAVVSSPLARTRETAGIVADRLGLDVSIEDGLRETDFGDWEGLTFAEVRERHPEDLNAWLASPDVEPTGGGESFAATGTRLAATRDKLVAAYAGRTVLLVTHVTPIKTLVRLALGAPPESLFRMELSAASLSVVAYYADGNASVRLLNDTSHLR